MWKIYFLVIKWADPVSMAYLHLIVGLERKYQLQTVEKAQ